MTVSDYVSLSTKGGGGDGSAPSKSATGVASRCRYQLFACQASGWGGTITCAAHRLWLVKQLKRFTAVLALFWLKQNSRDTFISVLFQFYINCVDSFTPSVVLHHSSCVLLTYLLTVSYNCDTLVLVSCFQDSPSN